MPDPAIGGPDVIATFKAMASSMAKGGQTIGLADFDAKVSMGGASWFHRASPTHGTGAPCLTSRPLILTGAAAGLALAGTAWLWADFGAAVFFETIRAGLVMCFG